MLRTFFIPRFPIVGLALVLGAAPSAHADLPPRPEDITFPSLSFDPPNAADYRHTLANGTVVYLAPSSEFPLVNFVFTFRGGSFMDPADRVGLADMTAAMMRRGGTTSLKPADFDEQADFLAATMSVNTGATESSASLNCLKSNLDEALSMFMDMLRNPGFDSARLSLYKSETLERLKQRNDEPAPILSREWRALLYGRDHYEGRIVRSTDVNAATEADLRTMHSTIFNPANLIIAVTGDFETQAMLKTLEKALAGWEAGTRAPEPTAPPTAFQPGLYYVDRDLPQGNVFVGLRSIKRDDPDYFPLLLMNDILGGGGFTSRITSRVRSDEGLAYSAGSGLAVRVHYPGELRASFQSKNATVALAIKIIMEEFEKIRSTPVTDAELETSKASFIETFPRTFESKAGMLAVFVNDEITNRPPGYWTTYRERIAAVTPAEIQRVAGKYLKIDDLAIMVVGKWAEIAPGDATGRAKMADFFNGNSTRLPLRDPLTMEILGNQGD